MLHPIVVIIEIFSSIERWIDIDALHLPPKLLLQRLQRQQVVALDQQVVETIGFADAMRGMIRQRRILQQDAWLQARTLFLANPG
ncbi:hypothetical protein Xmer_10850 [Xanthomonas campestris pv. merremiae]|nr:hypothetical protein [Xanthomonas campestris pv. merremiae]